VRLKCLTRIFGETGEGCVRVRESLGSNKVLDGSCRKKEGRKVTKGTQKSQGPSPFGEVRNQVQAS
jgi:hypothetical protein